VPAATRGTDDDTDNRVLRVCRLLNRYRVRYLIAGGVAANLHGSVRLSGSASISVTIVSVEPPLSSLSEVASVRDASALSAARFRTSVWNDVPFC
jgi:hypothetical protein